MATHSSVLAWRIPGTGESGGLPSVGSHRVGHDWSDLAAAAAALMTRKENSNILLIHFHTYILRFQLCVSQHCLRIIRKIYTTQLSIIYVYMNTRKNQQITEYWYIASKYNWHDRETYKINTTPVFHIFYYTGEIYKTIYAIKVETSKCHNNVWNQTLEIVCPLKRTIMLNTTRLSLNNKSLWCSWYIDMPPATACQKL